MKRYVKQFLKRIGGFIWGTGGHVWLWLEHPASLLNTCDTMKATLRRGNIYQGKMYLRSQS